MHHLQGFFQRNNCFSVLRKSEGASLLPPEWSLLQMVMLQRCWNYRNLKEDSKECCIFLTLIPQKSKMNFALNESQVWKKKKKLKIKAMEYPTYKSYQLIPLKPSLSHLKYFQGLFLGILNNLINVFFIAFLEKISCVRPHCHCYLPCTIETKLRGAW